MNVTIKYRYEIGSMQYTTPNNKNEGIMGMSEEYFLEKCIQTAEDVKGAYTEMSHMDLDPASRLMYKGMVTDATNHLKTLNNRLDYLKQQTKETERN